MVAYINPKTKSQTGVICDLCGSILENKFQYYSAKIDLVQVDSELKKTGVLKVEKNELNIDICLRCIDNMKSQMLQVINKRENKGGGTWTAKT